MGWKNPNDDPLDKLSDAILRKPKCDYCSYRPKNFTDYVAHLKAKHPENGDTASGRVSTALAVAVAVVLIIVSLGMVGGW